MSINILVLVVLVMYALTALLVFRSLQNSAATILQGRHRLYLLALVSSLLFHAILLKIQIITPAGLNLSFGHAVSLIMWLVTVLYLVTSIARPLTTMGVVLLPLTIVAILISALLPGSAVVAHDRPLMHMHIAVAVLAYSLLALAGVQALLVNNQEKALRQHQSSWLGKQLPALETMESLLYSMIWAGFLLLTLTLFSGVLFSEQVFGKPLVFNHHIVLSAGAWLVFATFLFGHWRWGWRGRNAVHWTLAGLVMLVLGYFGTKFVLEFLIPR
jgi:ABC-type uncharacterized transport system permease subunit